MKGVLLALGAFFLLVVFAALFLRLYGGRKYYKVLLAAFAVAVGVYSILYRVLPADLGFLPAGWLEAAGALNFLNGLLILTLLFVAFWDTVYTTVLTGFSANLMALLAEGEGLSREEILRIHGAEDGLDRVLAWRLSKLSEGRYLEAEDAGFRLLPKGWLVGTAARWLKRALTGSEEGG